jgi:hypothetical protein
MDDGVGARAAEKARRLWASASSAEGHFSHTSSWSNEYSEPIWILEVGKQFRRALLGGRFQDFLTLTDESL